MGSLSDLAEKYESLAIVKERLADYAFEASRSAEPVFRGRLLDEAESFLGQSIRFRTQAQRLRRQIEEQSPSLQSGD
jgi:hypothetical protein